jgi:hypothetical protein
MNKKDPLPQHANIYYHAFYSLYSLFYLSIIFFLLSIFLFCTTLFHIFPPNDPCGRAYYSNIYYTPAV